MEKVEFEGNVYYFNKGFVYDESFIEVPTIIGDKVAEVYFSKYDYKQMDEVELVAYIKHLKRAEKLGKCITAIEYGIDKFYLSISFYTTVFPIMTSCYRHLGQPQKAIDFWMSKKDVFASCLSTPLLTSLAAAYCDIGNYDLAKYCADKAYALQGGGQGYKSELSLVYLRIKKETKDKE